MGQNFFFAYTVVLQMGIAWEKALGAVFCALLKLVTGRSREVHWIVYLFAALFILRYAFLVRG